MKNHGEASLSNLVFTAPKAIRRMVGGQGWVDQEIVTLRKMNKAGKPPREIAETLGWSIQKLRARIKRDGIVLRNSVGWETTKATQSEATTDWHRSHGRGLWQEKATELRRDGLKYREVAAVLGLPHRTVAAFFNRKRRSA